MAEELGYSSKFSLVYAMTHSPVKPPQPALRHSGGRSVGHTWYERAAMRRWHAAHLQAVKEAAQELQAAL